MIILLLLPLVFGDVYMHNPKGSNGRNCERNVNRNNGNRVCDTQNNAKGGYACPRAVSNYNSEFPKNGITPYMSYVVGSKLEVEWTSQHGCGYRREQAAAAPNDNVEESVDCEITIQLLCTQSADPLGLYGKSFGGTRVRVPSSGIPNTDADAATNRIQTTDPGQAAGADPPSQNLRYSVHETPQWYQQCNRRSRNLGLFTADQNVNRRSAIGTRQNPNGGRRGLECPEERDYYPYWHPNPFIDVAYLVNDPARCGAKEGSPEYNALLAGNNCGGYENDITTGKYPKLKADGSKETYPRCGIQTGRDEGDWLGGTQGYKGPGDASPRWHSECVLTGDTFTDPTAPGTNPTAVVGQNLVGQVPKTNTGLTPNTARQKFNQRRWPNNKADCDALNDPEAPKYEWKAFPFTNGFDPAVTNKKVADYQSAGPECGVLDWSRANHLGNTGTDDQATRYTMTIPDLIKTGETEETCILRLRYNMSSSDYPRNLNSSFNQNNNANPAVQSPIQQDPIVKIGPGTTDYVELNLNTNQYSRTFQDRSYIFHIIPRGNDENKCDEIINVNVRGKRGNIVQTFPAVEYDFIPSDFLDNCGPGSKDTCLYFQWQGSDYNPQRGCNDASGGPYVGDTNVAANLNANTQGSNKNSRCDRANMLPAANMRMNHPIDPTEESVAATMGAAGYYGVKTAGKGFFDSNAVAQKFADGGCASQLQMDRANADPIYGSLLATRLDPLTKTEMEQINNDNRRENNPRNCGFANALSPYFATQKVTPAMAPGEALKFLSTRNNNFSNREQKFVYQCKVEGGAATAPPPLPVGAISSFKAQAFQMADAESAEYIAAMESDQPPFDPVENDNYGSGQKEGCTQETLFSVSGSTVTFLPGLAMLFALFLLF